MWSPIDYFVLGPGVLSAITNRAPLNNRQHRYRDCNEFISRVLAARLKTSRGVNASRQRSDHARNNRVAVCPQRFHYAYCLMRPVSRDVIRSRFRFAILPGASVRPSIKETLRGRKGGKPPAVIPSAPVVSSASPPPRVVSSLERVACVKLISDY